LPGNSNPRRLSHSWIAAITLHFHPSILLPLKVPEKPLFGRRLEAGLPPEVRTMTSQTWWFSTTATGKRLRPSRFRQ
ncbi:MAG: hypothetical protein ACI8TQ_002156, partial [Planctomycetota bacterium]